MADFERALDAARRLEQPLFLDLSHITLIDRPTLRYLVDVLHHDVRLVICPPFVEQWIARAEGDEPIE